MEKHFEYCGRFHGDPDQNRACVPPPEPPSRARRASPATLAAICYLLVTKYLLMRACNAVQVRARVASKHTALTQSLHPDQPILTSLTWPRPHCHVGRDSDTSAGACTHTCSTGNNGCD